MPSPSSLFCLDRVTHWFLRQHFYDLFSLFVVCFLWFECVLHQSRAHGERMSESVHAVSLEVFSAMGVFVCSFSEVLVCAVRCASTFRRLERVSDLFRACRSSRVTMFFRPFRKNEKDRAGWRHKMGGTTMLFAPNSRALKPSVRHAFQMWETLKGGFRLGLFRCASLPGLMSMSMGAERDRSETGNEKVADNLRECFLMDTNEARANFEPKRGRYPSDTDTLGPCGSRHLSARPTTSCCGHRRNIVPGQIMAMSYRQQHRTGTWKGGQEALEPVTEETEEGRHEGHQEKQARRFARFSCVPRPRGDTRESHSGAGSALGVHGDAGSLRLVKSGFRCARASGPTCRCTTRRDREDDVASSAELCSSERQEPRAVGARRASSRPCTGSPRTSSALQVALPFVSS